MRDEQDLREHWDQMCLRHHEGYLEEVGATDVAPSDFWDELTEELRVLLRPRVQERLEEYERIVRMGQIERIRMLREERGLSLEDAKRELLREQGLDPDHCQDGLAAELERALREEEGQET